MEKHKEGIGNVGVEEEEAGLGNVGSWRDGAVVQVRVDLGMGKWRRVRGMRRQEEVEEDEERWGEDK